MSGSRATEAIFVDDVLDSILQHADVATLGAVEQVCRSWHATLRSPRSAGLWREHCMALWRDRTQWRCDDMPASRRALQLSMRDAERQTITPEELSAAVWLFRFVGPDLAHEHRTPQEREAHAASERGQLSFAADGIYTSTMPGAPSASRPLPWKVASEGSCVRIASYPLLRVTRSKDWGWRMRNQFVEFYTVSCRPRPSLFA